MIEFWNFKKRQNFERQGSLDQISTYQDDLYVDRTGSKKKRVYGHCPREQHDTVEQRNDMMSNQNFLDDMDSQVPSKYPAVDKCSHESSVNWNLFWLLTKQNFVDDTDLHRSNKRPAIDKHGGQNKKISKEDNATKLANKQQGSRMNLLVANLMMVGTTIFLKSLETPNKNVALATLISSDPEYKIEGARLGNEFWAVHVEAALAKCDELTRPLKKVKIIDHAAGTIITWPSTFIAKING